MLKDRAIHEKLGIPIQTLQNWKKSDGYTFLLYQYLIHQDQEKFDDKVQSILDLNNYVLMKPKEFAILIKEHWNEFNEFSDYKPLDSVVAKDDEEDQTYILAEPKNDSKLTLVIQFVSGFSKRKDLFDKGLEKINNLYIETGLKKPKIIYVASSVTQPKYFGEYEQELSLITYSELYKRISDQKVLIV